MVNPNSELQATKKRAAFVARLVRGFWAQIAKVAAFKAQTKLDAERKEAFNDAGIIDPTEYEMVYDATTF